MYTPLLHRRFLERLERLTLHWTRSFPGLVGGHHPSRFGGAGQEFLDHRVFHAGDDLRSVNWRAYMRLDKLFLKVFQIEPRVPVRLLLDVSESMSVGHAPSSATKFEFAKMLAAALCYVGLVRLDTITVQPFASKLLDPFVSGGGRHRFQPTEEFLRLLPLDKQTDFLEAIRQFISEYPQRGLVIVISDFLTDRDCCRPLQYLADRGHELLLLQVVGDEDRMPSVSGDTVLIDSETGVSNRIAVDDKARRDYTARFDEYSDAIERLATHNGGRYASLSTATSLEEAVFGTLIQRKGVG